MAEKNNISWPGWEIVRLIGRGSFGEVYEIQRQVFDDTEKAALKVISIPQNSSDIEEMYSDGYDDESITSTFQSHLKSIVAEYSMMKKMNDCVNIVHCDDVRYVQHDNGIGWDIFIKMELLTPLTKVLPSDISEETVVKLGMDICRALMACSKYGIIHRDIKPQNIFVSSNGDYKLGDFGIAKTVEKTMGGTKIGTYKYMAPEVYNNQPYGQGADIYSLGLVLYFLLNEHRMPFMPLPPAKLQAGMDEEARFRRFSGEPITAPAHGSEKLKQIIMKACAFDPKARYQNAGEMLNDLNELCGFSKRIVYDDKAVDNSEEQNHCVDEGSNDDLLEDPIEDIGNDISDNFSEANFDGSNGITNNKSKKGKKIVITIGLGIVLFLLLRYCIHIHNWSNATCTMPRVCECGETEGNPLGHQWQNATCTQAKTCTRCGMTEGRELGHQWIEATYTTPKTCSVCEETSGEALVDRRVISASAGCWHVALLKADGTVTVKGHSEDYGQYNTGEWEDIIAISAGRYHTVGLKADGTVVATGRNDDGQCDVSSWHDIIAISAGYDHTVGLRADGSVIAVGSNRDYDDRVGGQCDVSTWTNIVEISAGSKFTVGLKADGTVVAVGWNGYGQCDVSNWRDIVHIDAGYINTVGLKADGTAVSVGYKGDSKVFDVSDWRNIVSISVGNQDALGLKSDGTVVCTSSNELVERVKEWSNIVAIEAGMYDLIGITSDGLICSEDGFYD